MQKRAFNNGSPRLLVVTGSVGPRHVTQREQLLSLLTPNQEGNKEWPGFPEKGSVFLKRVPEGITQQNRNRYKNVSFQKPLVF